MRAVLPTISSAPVAPAKHPSALSRFVRSWFTALLLTICLVVAAERLMPKAAAAPPDPIADAGPDRSATLREVTALDGSGSQIQGNNVLGYNWMIVAVPAGSDASLSDGSAPRPTGEVTSYVYDDLDRLLSSQHPASVGAPANDNLAFGYDANGNLSAANDNDSELSFTPDPLNRLQPVATGPLGIQPLVTLSHSYNAVHDLTQTVDTAGSGGTTAYQYDALSRLIQVTTPAAQVVSLDHDAAGRITSIDNPNGVDAALAFDPAGRLQSLAHGPSGAEIVQKSYGYDSVGNINAITGLSRTRSFGYDELYRLTSAADDLGNESYGYDPEGNPQTSLLSAVHVTNDVNRL